MYEWNGKVPELLNEDFWFQYTNFDMGGIDVQNLRWMLIGAKSERPFTDEGYYLLTLILESLWENI